MKRAFINQLTGISTKENQLDQKQLAMLSIENFIPTRERGTLRKRPGTALTAASGLGLGIGGYLREGSGSTPSGIVPIRHRRSGSNSYIEKFSWSAGDWTTITPGAAFSLSGATIASFVQVDSLFAIISGRPAMIRDIDSGNVDRLGGPAPSAAPSVAASVGAGALTGTFQCFYTFYNSTTGWESSPSPFATLTITSKDIEWTGLEATVAKEGVTHKRLYRTQDTGELPCFRVTEITLATTTYTDSVINDNLGAIGPEIGDHDPPPTDSYLAVAYDNCIWIASGSKLWRSHRYDGNLAQLEYFSEDRTDEFNYQITGLIESPRDGGLLIFKPPGMGIDSIRGRGEDYGIYPYIPKEGTLFPPSVSSNSNEVVFWGDGKPRMIRGGSIVPDFGEGIDDRVRDVAISPFTQDLFVWSQWMSDISQFIFSISGKISTSLWGEADSDIVVEWEDAESGYTVDWEEETP